MLDLEEIALGAILDGRYLLEKVIGVGASATVFRALDESLDRLPVAVKVAHRGGDARIFEQTVQRYRSEVAIGRTLSHPNIVRTYEFGITAGGTPYQTMELVAGESLAELVGRECGTIPAERRYLILKGVLEALSYAHEQGVAHRDVKPSNIFLGADGSIKLGDFGIARSIGAELQLTRTGELLGTVRYMSPERLAGHVGDTAGDVFAFGLLCFQLVTGEAPSVAEALPGVLKEYRSEEPLRRLRVHPNSSTEWEGIVGSCCARDPRNRPSAKDLLKAFSEPELVVPAEVALRLQRTRRLRVVSIGLALTVLPMLAMFAALKIRYSSYVVLSLLVAWDLDRGAQLYRRLCAYVGAADSVLSREQMVYLFAEHGRVRGLRTLLEANVSPNPERETGDSALCAAIRNQRIDAVRALLDHGALQTSRCDGESPIHSAVMLGSVELFDLLHQNGGVVDGKCLVTASSSGSQELIKRVFDSAENIAAAEVFNGVNAIDWSLLGDNRSLFFEIVRRVQDLDPVRVRGNTLLTLAAFYNRSWAVEFLMDSAGLDPQTRGADGGSAVTVAAQANARGVAALFHNRGIDFDRPDGRPPGLRAIFLACAFEHYDLAEDLLVWGVDSTVSDANGFTPLSYVMDQGRWLRLAPFVARNGLLVNSDAVFSLPK